MELQTTQLNELGNLSLQWETTSTFLLQQSITWISHCQRKEYLCWGWSIHLKQKWVWLRDFALSFSDVSLTKIFWSWIDAGQITSSASLLLQ